MILFVVYNVVTNFIFTVETWKVKDHKVKPKPTIEKPGKAGAKNPAKRQAIPSLLAGQFDDLRGADKTNTRQRKRPADRTLVSDSEDDSGEEVAVTWGVSDVTHCRELVKLTKCFNICNSVYFLFLFQIEKNKIN